MGPFATYEQMIALLAQDADNFEQLVIPSMPVFSSSDPKTGIAIEHRDVGEIVLLCNGSELLLSRQLASEMLTKGYFQKHNLPIVVSATLQELDRPHNDTLSESE